MVCAKLKGGIKCISLSQPLWQSWCMGILEGSDRTPDKIPGKVRYRSARYRKARTGVGWRNRGTGVHRSKSQLKVSGSNKGSIPMGANVNRSWGREVCYFRSQLGIRVFLQLRECSRSQLPHSRGDGNLNPKFRSLSWFRNTLEAAPMFLYDDLVANR